MASPLDDLLSSPDEMGQTERLFQTNNLQAGEDWQGATQRVKQENRMRAEDLQSRGIPTFTDENGDVSAVHDETGSPLSGLDKATGIAYDSKGQPKKINFTTETGPPELSDPFEGLPTTTDKKTGDQYQVAKGLPWRYVGQDRNIVEQNQRAEQNKAIRQAASDIGGKLTQSQAEFVQLGKQYGQGLKQMRELVPTLTDPQYEGADPDTIMQAIDSHFDEALKTPEANKKNGWFSSDLSPDAQAERDRIETARQTAKQKATELFSTAQRQSVLHDQILNDRTVEDQLKTRMADESKRRLAELGINLGPTGSVAVDAQGNPVDQQAANLPNAQSAPVPDGRLYSKNSDGTLSFKGEGQAVASLKQAVEDKQLDPETYKKVVGTAAMADAKYANLVAKAGDNTQLQALLRGTAVGAGAGAAMAGGFAAGMALANLTGIGEGTLEIGGVIAGIIGALSAGAVYNAAKDKILAGLADYSDTIKSLNASAELHPTITGASEFAGAVATSGGVEAVGKTAQSLAMASRTGNLSQGIKVLAKNLGIAGGVGAGFELTVRPLFDSTRYMLADQLGISHDPLQAPTPESVLQMAAFSTILGGKSIQFRDVPAANIASIFARGQMRERAGLGVSENVDPTVMANVFQRAGYTVDPAKMDAASAPLTPEEAVIYKSLDKQFKKVSPNGEAFNVTPGKIATIGGDVIASEGGLAPHSGALGEGVPVPAEPNGGLPAPEPKAPAPEPGAPAPAPEWWNAANPKPAEPKPGEPTNALPEPVKPGEQPTSQPPVEPAAGTEPARPAAPFQPAETIRDAEARLFNLTRDSDPQELSRMRKEIPDKAARIAAINVRLEKLSANPPTLEEGKTISLGDGGGIHEVMAVGSDGAFLKGQDGTIQHFGIEDLNTGLASGRYRIESDINQGGPNARSNGRNQPQNTPAQDGTIQTGAHAAEAPTETNGGATAAGGGKPSGSGHADESGAGGGKPGGPGLKVEHGEFGKPGYTAIEEAPRDTSNLNPWELTQKEWNDKTRFYRSGKTKNAQTPTGERVILKRESTQKNHAEVSADFYRMLRKNAIIAAIRAGHPIPDLVLKDYPELYENTQTPKESSARAGSESNEATRSGRENVAPKGDTEKPGKTVSPARKSVESEIQKNRNLFNNLGIELSEGETGRAGIAASLDRDLVFSDENHTRAREAIKADGGDPDQWSAAAVREEGEHLKSIVAIDVLGKNFKAFHIALWNHLPKPTRDAISAMRPGEENWQLGAEYVRMVSQYRRFGWITETHIPKDKLAAEALYPLFEADQPKLLEDILAQMERFETEPVAQVEASRTPAPAEKATAPANPEANAPPSDANEEWRRSKLEQGITKRQDVSASAVDDYGIKLPKGYVRDGDRYVFNPDEATAKKESAYDLQQREEREQWKAKRAEMQPKYDAATEDLSKLIGPRPYPKGKDATIENAVNAAARMVAGADYRIMEARRTGLNDADLKAFLGDTNIFGIQGTAGDAMVWGGDNPRIELKGQTIKGKTLLTLARRVLGIGQPDTTVDSGAHEAASSPKNELAPPTPAQAQAGNYKKGDVNLSGLPISIENPAGSTREGKDWKQKMRDHYGYIRQTEGKDGDHLDIFIKPGTPLDWTGTVYVVNQIDPKTGRFDEHKAIAGASDESNAMAIYNRNYPADWRGFDSIISMPFNVFKDWTQSGKLTKRARNMDLAPEKTSAPLEALRNNVTGAIERGEKEAIVEQPAKVDSANLPSREVSPLKTLHTAGSIKIKAPAGATVLRVVDNKGRKTIEPITQAQKGLNPFVGAGPFKKIEAGNMAKGGIFNPIRGKVEITDTTAAAAPVAAPAAKPMSKADKLAGSAFDGLLDSKQPESNENENTGRKYQLGGENDNRTPGGREKLSGSEIRSELSRQLNTVGVRVKKSGIRVVEAEKGTASRSGLEYDIFTRELKSDIPRLTAWINRAETPKGYLSTAITEEFIHATHQELDDVRWIGDSADALRESGNEDLVQSIYGPGEPGMLGTEYVRMLAQVRSGKPISESFLTDTSELEAALAKPQPAYAEDMAREIGAKLGIGSALDAKAPIHFQNATVTRPGLITLNAKAPIAAFHGTPHKVDRFSSENIGTGEGAQVYGWGIYFAEHPEVAKSYVDVNPSVNLPPVRKFMGEVLEPGSPGYHAATLLSRSGETLSNVRKEVAGWIRNAKPGEDVAHYKAVLNVLSRAKSKADFKESKRKGNLYHVTLDVEPDELLDWDKTFDQQPEKVKDALRAIWKKYGGDPENERPFTAHSGATGESIYAALAVSAGPRNASDKEIEKSASMELMKAGVQGIRYLDAGSRKPTSGWGIQFPTGQISKTISFDSKEEAQAAIDDGRVIAGSKPVFQETPGTYNYVIFDDSKIRIVKENGEPVTAAERDGVLNAKAPELVQEGMPKEKRAAMLDLADAMIEDGTDTPRKMAAWLQGRFDGRANKFSQALWDALGMVDPKFRGTHDWNAIYASLQGNPEEEANIPVPEAKSSANNFLSVPEPNTESVESAKKQAEVLRGMLQKNQGEYTALRDEQIELKKEVINTRGDRWSRGNFKKSAPKAKVQRYQELEKEMSDMNSKSDILRESLREQENIIEESNAIRSVNDDSRPIIQRLMARQELYWFSGSSVPEELTRAIGVEQRKLGLEAVPDANDAEAKAIGARLSIIRAFSPEEYNRMTTVDPEANPEYMRGEELRNLVGNNPTHALSDGMLAEIGKYTDVFKAKYGATPHTEKLTREATDRLISEIIKDVESENAKREKIAEEEQKEAERKAAENRKVTTVDPGDSKTDAVNSAIKAAKGDTTATKVLKAQREYLDAAIKKAIGEATGLGKVKIEVPGDGTFTVFNEEKVLKELGKKLASAFSPPTPNVQGQMKSPSAKLRSAPTKIERDKITKAVGEFVHHDESRYTLVNIFATGHSLIASNGKSAVEVEEMNEGSKENPVLMSPEGKRLSGKESEDVGNWRPHLEQIQKYLDASYNGDPIQVPVEDLYRMSYAANVIASRETTPARLWKNSDATIGMTLFDGTEPSGDGNGYYESNKQEGATLIGKFNPELLRNVAGLAAKHGSENVDIGMAQSGESDGNNMLLVRSEGFKAIIAVMSGVGTHEDDLKAMQGAGISDTPIDELISREKNAIEHLKHELSTDQASKPIEKRVRQDDIDRSEKRLKDLKQRRAEYAKWGVDGYNVPVGEDTLIPLSSRFNAASDSVLHAKSPIEIAYENRPKNNVWTSGGSDEEIAGKIREASLARQIHKRSATAKIIKLETWRDSAREGLSSLWLENHPVIKYNEEFEADQVKWLIDHGLPGHTWNAMVANEEFEHSIHLFVSRNGGVSDEALLESISDELLDSIRAAYGEGQDAAHLAAEYIRMLRQIKRMKSITEDFGVSRKSPHIQRIKELLTREQPEAVKTLLAQMDAIDQGTSILHAKQPEQAAEATPSFDLAIPEIESAKLPVRGERATDPHTGKTGTVIAIKGSKAVLALDEGGKLVMKLPTADDALNAKAPEAFREMIRGIMKEGRAAVREFKLHGPKDLVTARFDAAVNISEHLGEQAKNAIKLHIPNAQDRDAMPFIVEAGGNPLELVADMAKVRASKDPKLAKKFAPIVQHAITNFARLNRLRAKHDQMMEADLNNTRAAGIDVSTVKDYITRILEMPEDKEEVFPNPIFSMGSGTGGGRYFTKGRSFLKLADAIQAGYRPKTSDIATLDGKRITAGERLRQHKKFLNLLMATNSPTDGRPIIGELVMRPVISGGFEATVPMGYTVVNAAGRPIPVHNDFAALFKDLYGNSAIRNTAAGRAILKFAAIAKHGTLVFDTFHVGRVSYKQAVTGGGLPIQFRKGGVAWNIHYGRALIEFSNDELDNAVSRGEITKEEAGYARKNRVPFNELLAAGLNIGRVADNLLDQARLHIPVISTFNDWLFGKLSRSAMAQTALIAYDRNLKSGKFKTKAEAARQTAKEMNEIFGNLQNQGIFKSRTLQDIARLILLAPQWTESQFKYEGRAYGQILKGIFTGGGGGNPPIDPATGRPMMNPDGTPAKASRGAGNAAICFAMGVAALLLVNQVINYLTRGKSTFENDEPGHKLDAWIPGGMRGFWFNPFEIAGEYAHAAMKYIAQHEAPFDAAVHIASNKLSPLSRGIKEAVSGRDYAGRRFLDNWDRTRSAVTSALPMPMPLGPVLEKDPRSPTGYRLTRMDGAWEKQALQSMGAKVSPVQSPRSQMFVIAKNYRADRGTTDTAGEYTDLRRALDTNNVPAALSELAFLAKSGKTADDVRRAVGIREDGQISPEMFAGGKERELDMLKHLTPAEKVIYAQAQRDHIANAVRLKQLLARHPVPGLVSKPKPLSQKRTMFTGF